MQQRIVQQMGRAMSLDVTNPLVSQVLVELHDIEVQLERIEALAQQSGAFGGKFVPQLIVEHQRFEQPLTIFAPFKRGDFLPSPQARKAIAVAAIEFQAERCAQRHAARAMP